MHGVLAQVSTDAGSFGFPWWLQVTHFINFLFIGLLIRSGWEILATHGSTGAMTAGRAPSG